MTKLAIPTVHLNGTDGLVLQAQNEAALAAVEAVIERLAEAAPHSRDYYVQEETWDQFIEGMSAYHAASKQHAARLTVLGETRDELRAIVRGIRRQNEARNNSRQGCLTR